MTLAFNSFCKDPLSFCLKKEKGLMNDRLFIRAGGFWGENLFAVAKLFASKEDEDDACTWNYFSNRAQLCEFVKTCKVKTISLSNLGFSDLFLALDRNDYAEHLFVSIDPHLSTTARENFICNSISKLSKIVHISGLFLSHCENMTPLFTTQHLQSLFVLVENLTKEFMIRLGDYIANSKSLKSLLICLPENYVVNLSAVDIGAFTTTIKKNFTLEILSISAYRDQFDKVTVRNVESNWKNIHKLLLDVTIAISILNLPVYVILFIVDWLPYVDVGRVRQYQKVILIEDVIKSIRRVVENRKNDSKKVNKQKDECC